MPKSLVGGIEIIRGNNGIRRETKLVLFINGRWAKAPQSHIALLACLHDEIGHLIPYETLCSRGGDQETEARTAAAYDRDQTSVGRAQGGVRCR